MNTEKIINRLEETPSILKELVAEIPKGMLMLHRIPGKWCIHEHAVHIAAVHPMLMKRLRAFIDEERPGFAPYIPGKTTDPDDLKKMDLDTTVAGFEKSRKEFTALLRTLTDEQWKKEADHTQYTEYTAFIMARHILLHDHTHMFRIEELWLSRNLAGD